MGVRTHLMGASGILALGLLLGACDNSSPAARAEAISDPSSVAAMVNGQAIYVSDVNLEAESQNLVQYGGRLEIDSAEFNQLLDELIDVKLLAMEAETRSLDEDPQARHRLDSARQHILGNILIDAMVAERVDEGAIRKMYDAQIAIWELGEEARVRHILAPSKEEIEKIAVELRGGGDFAVVASRRSTDDVTRMDGGDLGYMSEDEATPEFARIIHDTATGTVSRPFQTEMGWHVIKIEERRKQRPPSLEELRDPILKHLTRVQIGDVLKELRTSARIEKMTAPQNSSLEVDPFRAAPPETAPPIEASAPRAAESSQETREPETPTAETPGGPVSEPRPGAAQ